MSATLATTVTVLPMKAFGAPVMSSTLLVAPAASHSGAAEGDGDGCVSEGVIAGVTVGDCSATLLRSVGLQSEPNTARTMSAAAKNTGRFFISVPSGNQLVAMRRIRRKAGKHCDKRVGSILAPHWRSTPRSVRCNKLLSNV